MSGGSRLPLLTAKRGIASTPPLPLARAEGWHRPQHLKARRAVKWASLPRHLLRSSLSGAPELAERGWGLPGGEADRQAPTQSLRSVSRGTKSHPRFHGEAGAMS